MSYPNPPPPYAPGYGPPPQNVGFNAQPPYPQAQPGYYGPPQPGYGPPQPGYGATVYDPNKPVTSGPTTVVYVQDQPHQQQRSNDMAKDCCLIALCAALCCCCFDICD